MNVLCRNGELRLLTSLPLNQAATRNGALMVLNSSLMFLNLSCTFAITLET